MIIIYTHIYHKTGTQTVTDAKTADSSEPIRADIGSLHGVASHRQPV